MAEKKKKKHRHIYDRCKLDDGKVCGGGKIWHTRKVIWCRCGARKPS